MNIFVLDKDPIKAAKWQCDKHCVKMPTETLQMLSCAAIRHNVPENLLPLTKKGTPVRGGYKNHPCSIWAGNNNSNYEWLCKHGIELCKEYTRRYNKTHFCEKGIFKLWQLINYIPDGELEDFPVAINESMNCRRIEGFNQFSIVKKYRLYYQLDKPFATWKQNKPHWI